MASRNTNNGTDLTQDSNNQALVLDNLDLTNEDIGVGEDDSNGELSFDDDPLSAGDDNLDDGDDGNDIGEQQQRQQRQPEQRQPRELDDLRVTHKPLAQRAEVKADKKGNLVDASGQIVARAGAEARLYQKAHQAGQQVAQSNEAVTQITDRFNRLATAAQGVVEENKQFKARDHQLQQFGLKPDEQLRAYQIFTELRDQPEVALKKLLTRAGVSGIDLAKLGLEPGGFDAKSLMDLIRSEIGTAVKPVQDQAAATKAAQEQQQRDQQIQDDATAKVHTFIQENPEAVPHLPVIQQLLAKPQFRGMTLEHLWDRIQLNLLRNGNTQQRTNPNSRRMPSGRGAVAPNRNGEGVDTNIAPVDTSYEQIIRDAMGQ